MPMIKTALIFEDEAHTAQRLKQMLQELGMGIEVLGTIESVEGGIDWFRQNVPPDLLFMDIQLSDGNCFEFFHKVKIEKPVIFTTAYNQYALQAFSVNSMAYLLKPISKEDLKQAIEKVQRSQSALMEGQLEVIKELFSQKEKLAYKKRFLVKRGDQYKVVLSADIAFFRSEDGLVFAHPFEGRAFPIESSLDSLVKMMDPMSFFRVNRKYIVQLDSVIRIHSFFNMRLKLELRPKPHEDVIVSRERVAAFKDFLNT